MENKQGTKIIKIRLIYLIILLVLIFGIISLVNVKNYTQREKVQEAAQNALSKSSSSILNLDYFETELNKKIGKDKYQLKTTKDGYIVTLSDSTSYSVSTTGEVSQRRWITIAGSNKIMDQDGNEYNIGDYVNYNPNIPDNTSKIVDFIKPIWEGENIELVLNENNIATIKFTLRGSDTYYLSDTIKPGNYVGNSNEIKENMSIFLNSVEATSDVKVKISAGKKLMEERTIDGKTQNVQYGIAYDVEIYTAIENIEQVKILIPANTMVDQMNNYSEEETIILFGVLRPTNTETSETSRFLNINGIVRKDIEKVVFVKGKDNVVGTTYYDVSAQGDKSIIAGYEDKDKNGKYEVYIGSDFDIYVNKNSSYLFANTSIVSIENVELLYTTNSNNMDYMFYNCQSLKEMSLKTNFNTLNVKSMINMFGECRNLATLDLGTKFDTEKVINLQNMFNECRSLIDLNIGEKFNTEKVENMSYLFNNCYNITKIDLKSKFNTSMTTNTSYMFNNCKMLTTLDLKDKFNTEKVTNTSYMFNNCTNLTSLNIGEKFNTEKVTDMSYMFNGCSSLGELELKKLFYTKSVTNMNYMFGECTNLTVLDLGPAFTNIPTQNEKMLNKCGTIGCIIYCGESIYSDINNMKLNTDSGVLINYKIGTVNCKYKMTWSKFSSSFDVENKKLTIILKATGENTTYKETSSILKKNNISIYINDELADDGINVEKKLSYLKEDNESVYYTLELTNFEQSYFQKDKNFREWSGNVRIDIERKQTFDIYGNGNLNETINDEEIKQNTDNKLFADFIKPEFVYKYSNTEIDRNNGIVTIGFDVVDKYYSLENLKLEDLICKVYNEVTNEWETINVNNKSNTLNKKVRLDGYGMSYVLTIKNLEQEMGELYKNYSGYISITIPENKVTDLSGNKNIKKTITIGTDTPNGDNKNPVIVDVVKPIWRIENIEIHNKNFEENLTESFVYLDIIGTDKYYNGNTLNPSDILPIIDDENATNIKVEFEYFSGRKEYGVLVSETRENGNKVYGVKYRVKLSGFEEQEKQPGKEYLEWSGNLKVKISANTLVDESENANIETLLNVGMVDFINPQIEQLELTSAEISADKTNKTKTIKFNVIDKYFDSSSNTTLTKDNIISYVDGIEANLTKTLTYSDVHKTTNTGVDYVVRTYKLVLSNFEQKRTEVNYDREFIDWSGYVTIEIAENTIKDKTGNGNDKTLLIGGDVDYIKPTITYKYLDTDINVNEKTFTMTVDITDRYYNSNSKLTIDNLGVVKIDEADLLAAYKNGLINIEIIEKQDIKNTINDSEILVGKRYQIKFSNLQQNPNNGIDYSGILIISINANSIQDQNSLNNNKTIITSGIDLPSDNTNGEIVDVVSPYVKRNGLEIDTVNGSFKLSVIATDKYKIAEEQTRQKLTEAVNNKKIRIISENIDITETQNPKISLENITFLNNGTTLTFDIIVKGLKQDPTSLYMFLPSGVIFDEHSNKNQATMFAIINCLKVAYIKDQNRYESKPTDPFLGGPIQRQDIQKIIIENNASKLKDTSTQWLVSTSDIKQSSGKWEDEDVVWDGQAVIYAWFDEKQAPYTVHIGSNYDIDLNVDSNYLFANIGYSSKCTSEVTIENLERLETTTTVRTMEYMFYNTGYNNMKKFEIPDNFDTSNIVSMKGMFEGTGHNQMTTFRIGNLFDTKNVTNMEAMFKNFGTKVNKLDLGNKFATTSVENTKEMFKNCGTTSMTEIDMGPMFVRLGTMYDDFATNCGKVNSTVFLAPESIYSNLHEFKTNSTSDLKTKTNAKINPVYRPEWKLVAKSSYIYTDGKITGLKATIEGMTDTTIYKSEVTNTLTKNDIKIYFDDYNTEDLNIEIQQDSQNSNKYLVTIENWKENEIVNSKEYLECSGNIKIKVLAHKLTDKYGNQNLSEIAVEDLNEENGYKWENVVAKDEEMTNANKEGTSFVDTVKPQINYKYSDVKNDENPDINYQTKTVTVVFDVIDKYFEKTDLLADKNAELITVKVDKDEEADLHITKSLTKVSDITDEINGITQKIGEKYKLVISGLQQNELKDGELIKDYSGPIQLIFKKDIIQDFSKNKNISKTITIDTDNGDDDDNSIIVDVVDPIWTYKISSIDRKNKTVTIQFVGSDKYYKENNLMNDYKNKIKVLIDNEEISSINKNLKLISEDSQKVVYELTLSNFEKNNGLTQIVIKEGTILDNSGNKNIETKINVGNPKWIEEGDTEGKYNAFKNSIVDFTNPEITYRYSNVNKSENPNIDYENKTLTVGFKLTEKHIYENSIKEGANLTQDAKKIKIKVGGVDITQQLNISLSSSETGNGVKNYTLNISNFELDKILDGEEYKNYSGPVQLIFEKGLVTDTSGYKSLATTITIDYDDGDDEKNPIIVDVIKPIWSYYSSSIDRQNEKVVLTLKGTDKYLSKYRLENSDLKVLIDGEEISTISKEITKIPSTKDTYAMYRIELSNFKEYNGKTQVIIAANTLEDSSGNKNISTTIDVGNPNWVEQGDTEKIYTAFKNSVVDFIKPDITYVTSSIDRTNKTVEVQFKLNDKHYLRDKLSTEKNGTTIYDTSYIHTLVNDVEIKTITKQLSILEENENGKIYKLTLSNFETNDKVVKITLEENMLHDTSGNKNEALTLAVGNPNWTKDDAFPDSVVDFIKPEITYIYEKNQSPIIDKKNKTVTFKFKVTDTNYIRNTFDESLMEIKIDGKTVGENITRTMTSKNIINDENKIIGLEYTVVLSNFEIERMKNEAYTRYSGTLEIIIPDGRFFDTSGNSNDEKSIIICEEKETENINEATIIDFIAPKIYSEDSKVQYDYAKSTATINFETSDRFFKSNIEETDSNNNKVAIIEKNEIQIFDDNGDDVTETLDWKLSSPIFTSYGYKYSITIQDYVDEFKFDFVFREGAIYDENGLYNKETILTYMVDDVKPRIKYKSTDSSLLDNKDYYKTTVNINAIDRYLVMEDSNITSDDIKIYKDGVEVTEQISLEIEETNAVSSVPRSKSYTINLSKLSVTGTYSIVFKEGILIDEEKNKNLQTTITFSKSAIMSTNYEEVKYFVDDDVIYVNELLNINETGKNNAREYTPSTLGELFYEGKNSNFSEKIEYLNGKQNAKTFLTWAEADAEGNYIYYKDSSCSQRLTKTELKNDKITKYLKKYNVYDKVPNNIKYLKAMWQTGKVIYVSSSKGNDNNDGLSFGTSVKTFEKAIEKLSSSNSETANYVVITDEVTLSGNVNKNVTITSLYGGIDYQNTNNAKLKINSNINLLADVMFDNIKIDSISTTISNGKKTLAEEEFSNLLIANYHNITLGRRISTTNGKYTFGAVIGGNYKTESNTGKIGKNQIIIESGIYNNIIVGSSILDNNRTTTNKYVKTTLQIGSKKDGAKGENNKLSIKGYLMLGQNETNYYSYEAYENDDYTNMNLRNYATIEFVSGTFLGANLYNVNSEKAAIYLRSINSTTEGIVTFKMYGGEINGNVYAGSRTINNSTNEFSTYMYLYGGKIVAPEGVFGQGATENFYGSSKITLTGIINILGNVYGGSNATKTGYGNGTANSEINITGSSVKISGNVYGGSRQENSQNLETTGVLTGKTNVNVSGTISTNIYGGGYNANVTEETNVKISGTITGNIYGGSYQSYVGKKTNVSITGKILGDIYGGGESTDNGIAGVGYIQNSQYISGETNIELQSGTIGNKNLQNNVYGGNKSNKIYETEKCQENTNISIGKTGYNAPIIYSTIYGGGINEKLNSTNINIIDNARERYLTIYGASNEECTILSTNININGGFIANVYGSGRDKGNTDTTNITIAAGSISNVYGAGNNNSSKKSNIIMNKGSVSNIYGGANGASQNIEKTNVKLNGGVVSNVYGAGLNSGAIETNIEAKATYVENIYGGSDTSGVVSKSNINVLSGNITNVYGGNLNGGYTIESNVNIQKTAQIRNDLFAGGKNSDIGSENIKGKSTINITGGSIYKDINGGSYLGKVYGETNVNIGKNATTISSDKIENDDIYILGDIFAGGTSEYSKYKNQYDNSQISDYNFDKVTSVVGNSNIRIDGKTYMDFKNNIYGTGNASKYTGTSNIIIENYGTQSSIQEIKSIQRASNLYIGNSYLEIDGKQDILSASNRATYSLNKIDSVTLYKASSLYVQSEFNLVKEFNSYVDKEKTQKATQENTINRLYTLEALNLIIAKQETYADEIQEYGDVNGLTFFGMYAFRHSGNNNKKIYDIYDPNTNSAKLGTGTVFIQGAYVQGNKKKEHNLNQDGFYSNILHNKTVFSNNETIIPYIEGDNYYDWVIGINMIEYNVALTASVYSRQSVADLKLDFEYLPNAKYTVSKVSLNALKRGIDLVDPSVIKEVADNTDIANSQFGLSMQTTKEGNWTQDTSNNIYTEDEGTVKFNGLTFDSDSSENPPILRFKLYNSLNITKNQNLGRINLVLIGKTTNAETQETETFLVVISVDLKTVTEITDTKYVTMFKNSDETTRNYTSDSQLDFTYRLFHNNEYTIYDDDKDKRVISSTMQLPTGTKLTLIDTSNPTGKVYYRIIKSSTDFDGIDKDSNGNITNYLYYFENFTEMGCVEDSIKYSDKLNGNSLYYHEVDSSSTTVSTNEGEDESQNKSDNYAKEDFEVIVDFEKANIKQNLMNQDIHVELRNSGEVKYGQDKDNIRTFNLWSDENKKAKMQLEVTKENKQAYLFSAYTRTININASLTGAKINDEESGIVLDTKYFDKIGGLAFRIVDSNDNDINYSDLTDFYLETTEENKTIRYNADLNGVIRFNISSGYSFINKNYKINIIQNKLPTGKYKIKIYYFFADDGKHYENEELVAQTSEIDFVAVNKDDTSIGILQENGNRVFNIIYNENGSIVAIKDINENTKGIDLKLKLSGVEENNNITVELYKRNATYEKGKYVDANYTSVDLNEFLRLENELNKKDSSNEYIILSTCDTNDITLNFNANFVTSNTTHIPLGEYKLVFKMYYENYYIQEVEKTFIITE